ncbi:MAG: HD domain-containing protein [Schaedlerella sp.]|nr:HD domain-containing protein [Schaedlerella sp.]
MRECEAIRNHPLYKKHYKKLKKAESDRIFCCHQMEHYLDVARIAYILNLEQNLGFRKEVIYAAALLHDIGKYRQYKKKIPHEIASSEIAKVILGEIAEEYYTEEEKKQIMQAILEHRKMTDGMSELGKLLYISDKKSRACYQCLTEKECNWSMEKKNMEIDI